MGGVCGTSRNVSDPASSSVTLLQHQPVERRLKKASAADKESPPPVTFEEEEEGGGQSSTTASGKASQQPAALAEEQDSLPDGAAASARCFAHHYVKAISAPGRTRVVRRQLNRGTPGAPGATFPGEDGVAADDGPKYGFPAGGLSALGNIRDQEGKGECSGGDGGCKPERESGARWWHDWESGGSDGEKVGDEREERRSLARSYMAHFKDYPPRCRPALREMARKAAENKAAAAAASNNTLETSPATAEAGPVAAADAGAMDRWHVPTLQGAVNFVEKKIKSAMDGCSEGGLQEQAHGVMHLEGSATDDVTVVARVRPFLAGEGSDRGLKSRGATVQVDSSDMGNPGRQFSFDAVVGETEGSGLVFSRTGGPAAKEVARGVSAVVFAFGQTGSGKTYTLLGGKGQDGVQREGVASMSYEALSNALKERAVRESGSERGAVEYTIECSILQVYLGGVYDLLGDDCQAELRMRSHVKAKTLKEAGGETCELFPRENILPCRDAKEFEEVLEKGIGKRAVRGTKMNATSSRSHCIVTLLVKREVRLERAGSGLGGGREHMARLVLVDLAGNERDSARQGADDEALLQAEGVDVNASLTALSSVLRMRSKGKPVGGASRISALTRLLREPLTSAKIFFVACVSPLRSAAITSSQTLGYATLVKKIKTDAEDSAVLLEEGLHRFPIEFIPHASLVKRGAIARSNEGMTVYLNELRAVVVKVFVSHRWLSPSPTPSKAHPDKSQEGNPKHKLVCECVNRIMSAGWMRSSDMLEIVDWIDFACINQDSHNPAEQLNGSMGRIIGSCDVMITPVHDPMWKEWAGVGGGKKVIDAFSDYGAVPFHEYLKRGWCRLEMFFNANVPFDTRRARLFDGKLKDVMAGERRRPHLVYGTRELELGLEPPILRKLEDDEFGLYHPGRGYLFDHKDAAVIGGYVDELFQINANLRNHQEDPAQQAPPSQPLSLTKSEKSGKTHADTETFDDAEFVTRDAMQGGQLAQLSGVTVWANSMVKGIQAHYTLPDGREVDAPKHCASAEKWGKMPDPQRIVLRVDPNDPASSEYLSRVGGRSGTVFDQVELHKKNPKTNKEEGKRFGGNGGGAFSVKIPAGHKVVAFYGGFGGDIHNIGVYTIPISGTEDATETETEAQGDQTRLLKKQAAPSKSKIGARARARSTR